MKNLFIAILLMYNFASCITFDDLQRITKLNIEKIEVVNGTTISMDLMVVDLSENTQTEFGICYSTTNPNPTVNDSVYIIDDLVKGFTKLELKCFTYGDNYYVKSYIKENGNIIYSNKFYFKHFIELTPFKGELTFLNNYNHRWYDCTYFKSSNAENYEFLVMGDDFIGSKNKGNSWFGRSNCLYSNNKLRADIYKINFFIYKNDTLLTTDIYVDGEYARPPIKRYNIKYFNEINIPTIQYNNTLETYYTDTREWMYISKFPYFFIDNKILKLNDKLKFVITLRNISLRATKNDSIIINTTIKYLEF